MFSQDEIQRYVRHFSVERIGIQGQTKLKRANILCIGAGGIGSPLLLYLAACGIGKLTIIDSDVVDISNLQRQVLFNEADIGKSKAQVAQQKIMQLNKSISVSIYNERLSLDNVETVFADHDLIVDGSDNFATRYLAGDACAQMHKPLISASVYQFTGQLIALNNQVSPCYRCLYPEKPAAGIIPNCSDAGVLGSVPGVLGVMAATEAIKHILDFPEKLNNQLLTVDLMNLNFRKYPVLAKENCKACKQHSSLDELAADSSEEFKNEVQSLNVKDFAKWISEQKEFTLIDVRQDWEREICTIDNDIHIPLAEIPSNFKQFKEPLVLYCHVGERSLMAANYLKHRGAKEVYNLDGGIIAWIEQVEPHKSKY